MAMDEAERARKKRRIQLERRIARAGLSETQANVIRCMEGIRIPPDAKRQIEQMPRAVFGKVFQAAQNQLEA